MKISKPAAIYLLFQNFAQKVGASRGSLVERSAEQDFDLGLLQSSMGQEEDDDLNGSYGSYDDIFNVPQDNGAGNDVFGMMLDFQDQASAALSMVPPQLLECVGLDQDLDATPNFGTEKKCSTDDTITFKQKISDFDQCTGWDTIELIEELPSILFGNELRCLKMIFTQFDDDATSTNKEDTKECIDSFFGENPFGSVLHDIILNSDNVCSCYNHVHHSPLPECTLDQWPIPVSGTAFNSFACIISFGCQFVDILCEMESTNLQSCLPYENEEYTCEGALNKCNYPETNLFLDSDFVIPLPGACRRVYEIKGKSELVERYDDLSEKCLKEPMDVWNKHVDFKRFKLDNNKDPSLKFEETEEDHYNRVKENIVASKNASGENPNVETSASNSFSHPILITALAFFAGAAAAFIAMRISNKKNSRQGRYGAISGAIEGQLPPIA